MSRVPILAMLLAGSLASAGLALADDPAEAPEREEANLRDVLRDLAAEANEQLRENRTWPRSESDYADAENLRLPQRDVVRTLARRVDRNAAIDAYVKWQLLSFLPSLDEFSGAEYNQIMRGLPELMPRPSLTNRQVQLFEFAEQAEDEDLVPVLNEANEAFEQNVEEVDLLNRPARAYRDAIIDNMPLENGVRWRVMVQDIDDRFAAGDMSFQDRLNELRRDVGRHRTNTDIPLNARRQLFQAIQRLAEQNNSAVEGITIYASGNASVQQIGRPVRGRDLESFEENLFPQRED